MDANATPPIPTVRPSVKSILHTWALNFWNGLVYVFSFGARADHEARFRGGTWFNWNRDFSIKPARFALPESEEAICALVKAARKLRVAGGGHTFNESPLSPELMISLDRYNRVLAVDRERHVMRAQAGMRLRDLSAAMAKEAARLGAEGQ